MVKIRTIVFTLVLNGLVPWTLYIILLSYMSSFKALLIVTMVPLIENVHYLIKHKRIDVFSSLMLFAFLFSLFLISLGGSEKLLLIRESFVTAGVGFIFLCSLLFRRPLIYHLAIRFIIQNDITAQSMFAD